MLEKGAHKLPSIILQKVCTYRMLGFFLIGTGCFAFSWGLWPSPQVERKLVFPGEQLMKWTGGDGNPQPGRVLKLSYPTWMRASDPGKVRMVFEPETVSTSPPAANLSTSDLYVETHLDLPGIQVEPTGVSGQVLPDGRAVTFWWVLYGSTRGIFEGTAWLGIRFEPTTGDEMQSQALAAPKVKIQVKRLLGLSGPAARWIGGCLVGTGLILLVWRWKRA